MLCSAANWSSKKTSLSAESVAGSAIAGVARAPKAKRVVIDTGIYIVLPQIVYPDGKARVAREYFCVGQIALQGLTVMNAVASADRRTVQRSKLMLCNGVDWDNSRSFIYYFHCLSFGGSGER